MIIEQLTRKLSNWHQRSLTRSRYIIRKRQGNNIVINGINCINFSSNDYLGIANHPKVSADLRSAIIKYGFGSGSSAVVSGYFDLQHQVEVKFSEWIGVDRTILFNSGYLANIGVMTALADRSSTIFSDKLIHASLLDGIQLSRAKHYRYQHNDIDNLTQLTKQYRPDFIITESIFSMEGDIAPIKEIISIASEHKAAVIIDDAHGIGVLGIEGAGIVEQSELNQEQLACLIAPLGKAFNGMGAIVAGRDKVIETILQFARTYRYTTAMPPALCAGLLSALNLVRTEKWRRTKLQELILFFIEQAKIRGISLVSNEITPIKSIVIGNDKLTQTIQTEALKRGFFVSCVRPPTVTENTSRIRISLNCMHEKKDVLVLLDLINEIIDNESH